MVNRYRRKNEADSVRQQVIDAAIELFLMEGYESVSMRKIAQKIGYSPTNIYNYFKDKQEILLSILQKGYAVFLGMLQQESEQHASLDFKERFLKTMKAYVQFGLKHPDYYRLIFILNPEQSIRLITMEDSDRIKGFRLLEDYLSTGMSMGVFREGNLSIYSRSVWASLHGMVSLLIGFPAFFQPQADSFIDGHLDMIVRALSKGL